MKLCTVSHKPVWRSAAAPSGFVTDGGFPFQMEAISSLFHQTELLVAERSAPANAPGAPLPSAGVRIVPLREPPGSDGMRKLFLAGSATYYLAQIAAHVARADVVHAVVPGDLGILGMLLAQLLRKRLFVRYCSSWPNTPQTTRACRLCKQWMARHSGGRNVMFATGLGETPPDGPGGQVRWIFSTSLHAADLEGLERVTARRESLPGLCRILYVGRLSPEKGLLNLLEALAQWKAREQHGVGGPAPRPCWQLTLAGHGPQGDMLQARAAALGIDARVRFTGLLDRAGVYRELAAADLFVLPSLTEGFPKALVEAMAAGLPVVASEVGAIPMIVGPDGAHGVMVPPGEPAPLAQALRSLSLDPCRRQAMGARARCRARAWTLEAWAGQIGAVLEQAWGLPLKRPLPG